MWRGCSGRSDAWPGEYYRKRSQATPYPHQQSSLSVCLSVRLSTASMPGTATATKNPTQRSDGGNALVQQAATLIESPARPSAFAGAPDHNPLRVCLRLSLGRADNGKYNVFRDSTRGETKKLVALRVERWPTPRRRIEGCKQGTVQQRHTCGLRTSLNEDSNPQQLENRREISQLNGTQKLQIWADLD